MQKAFLIGMPFLFLELNDLYETYPCHTFFYSMPLFCLSKQYRYKI